MGQGNMGGEGTMKRLVVLGANGMLGYAVSEYFSRHQWSVVRLTRNEYDIVNESMAKLEKLCKGANVVVNCAGVIKPQIKYHSVDDVLRINGVFPRNLAKMCNRMNIKCFHITTDCVYSGKKGKYSEEDSFDAEDLYGVSKNLGENNECMTLRTSIIGEEKNQSRSLLSWAIGQKGKEVLGFTNHNWNGVTTVCLSEIMETILKKNMYDKGVFHIFSKEAVTKYELLQLINRIYGLSLSVKEHENETMCDRTLSSVFPLNNMVMLKSLETQLEEMRKFFVR
jgi:dTDP-4-dehydrorhamnose reductase